MKYKARSNDLKIMKIRTDKADAFAREMKIRTDKADAFARELMRSNDNLEHRVYRLRSALTLLAATLSAHKIVSDAIEADDELANEI